MKRTVFLGAIAMILVARAADAADGAHFLRDKSGKVTGFEGFTLNCHEYRESVDQKDEDHCQDFKYYGRVSKLNDDGIVFRVVRGGDPDANYPFVNLNIGDDNVTLSPMMQKRAVQIFRPGATLTISGIMTGATGHLMVGSANISH